MIVKQNRKENAVLPNQTEVVKRLSELSRMLDAATDEIAVSDDKAVKAKGSYEVAYARSFLQSNGSMDVRRQEAILACADLRLAMEIAEAEVRAIKERINTLRSQISIGQSLSAAIRQIGTAGVASIVSLGSFHYTKTNNASVQGFGFNVVNNTTFNTTISNTLDVTAQCVE